MLVTILTHIFQMFKVRFREMKGPARNAPPCAVKVDPSVVILIGPSASLTLRTPHLRTEDDATIPSIFHQVQSLSFYVPDLERKRKVLNSQCESLLSRATLTAWGAAITWPAFAPAKPLRSARTPLRCSGSSPGLSRIRWVGL